MERKIAAIFAADVVGYGRLMEINEEGTRARFQADLREIFEPEIAKHHGRLVKTMGDGLLIEFHSVVDALRCAVEVERAMAGRNAGVPADQRLDFRIGINLGDVIVEGDDIHGDGVNIADRLQGLAEAGGIAISGTAYDHVKTKVEVGYEFLGEQHVKNIAEPVRVYRVLLNAKEPPKRATVVGKPWRSWRQPAVGIGIVVLVVAAGVAAWLLFQEPPFEPKLPLPDEPSVAVLPFTNMSGDPEQEYLAEGMTDDLITDLSQVSGLFVISRNSTFVYKDKAVEPRQVAKDLGVRYVLEGSIQRSGGQLRINAQLIDAVSGGHVWADRYDGSLSDFFALQDKVTHSIADALALRLTPEVLAILGQHETQMPAAYDAFLRGWEHFRRPAPEEYAKAIQDLERAVRLDPDYGRAYAALALIHWSINANEWNSKLGISYLRCQALTQQYLAEATKHPTATSHQVAGNLLRASGGYDMAYAEFKEAIALDPSDSWSYAYMARALTFAGRPAEALPYLNTAMRLDPYYPQVFVFQLGLAQFGLNRFDEAAAAFERAAQRNPENEYPFLLLGATYGYLGRKQEATSAIATYNALVRKLGKAPVNVRSASSAWNYKETADRDRLVQGLRLAGVPE